MIILLVIVIRIFKNNTGKIAANLISRMLRSQNFVLLLQQTAYVLQIFYVFGTFLTCRYMIINIYH